jgi:hypothetical protein
MGTMPSIFGYSARASPLKASAINLDTEAEQFTVLIMPI